MAHPVPGPIADPGTLAAWSADPWVVAPLAAATALYLRGWWQLHRRAPHRFGGSRLAAFLAGVGAVALALESPLHGLAGSLLMAHMVQHLLLLMVAPPLLWLGAPLVPVLRGLPRRVVISWVGPALRAPQLRALVRGLAHPAVAWLAFTGGAVVWHLPGPYQGALASEAWHHVQHACFLASGLLFWWMILSPWPARAAGPGWALVVALLLADVQNTLLSAWLTFSDRVVYPAYAEVARPWGIAALRDQAAAGVLMWIPGSIAFLIPAAWLVVRALSPRGPAGDADRGDRRWPGPPGRSDHLAPAAGGSPPAP
ncbi:MAG TPA: cytochrome c oxidase assembly protein [Candidatus Binatia bacterium]|nr:cytochrome c oxidase assembly protein [Candidatus Binatia bacterium]